MRKIHIPKETGPIQIRNQPNVSNETLFFIEKELNINRIQKCNVDLSSVINHIFIEYIFSERKNYSNEDEGRKSEIIKLKKWLVEMQKWSERGLKLLCAGDSSESQDAREILPVLCSQLSLGIPSDPVSLWVKQFQASGSTSIDADSHEIKNNIQGIIARLPMSIDIINDLISNRLEQINNISIKRGAKKDWSKRALILKLRTFLNEIYGKDISVNTVNGSERTSLSIRWMQLIISKVCQSVNRKDSTDLLPELQRLTQWAGLPNDGRNHDAIADLIRQLLADDKIENSA
ncbi:hypothetical protein AA0472_2708 [Acetobacter estunensis NRIC 0472]|uniref:Uncharacterized protein n=1 Tax=Acetobacter estunensis TaxID=104097 RepID=A0A967B9D7_9PROT|nr:hypothetical protein [Acetobacter estunensis]NHO52863.1 hypothetical protein [Acetobacter estunensis]GBQ28446.1 hypothetical protein AA0472_2708 [Acetobacter estunensis NRIC 0472]